MKSNIQSLVLNGQFREALSLYTHIHASSLQPRNFTFPFLLKACGQLQSVPQSQMIHTQIIKSGFELDIYTATSLTAAYMKLQLLEDALKVFETIPNPTLPSFNAIISGFSQSRRFEQSMCIFKRLDIEGLRPNSVTIASILPACQTAEQGSQLHSLSIKMGLELDVYVATALVTMYSNCAELNLAQRVFGLIQEKKVVSYNAMLSGFLRNRSLSMALDMFREIFLCSGERPSSSTLLTLLSVCSELSALLLGKQVHCYFLKCEVGSCVRIGTSLVDMYCKCGSLKFAYQVFMRLENKNLVTWNSMISGFITNGCLDTAVELFHKLRFEGFRPDQTTWNLMISGFSQQGNGVEALKFFDKMQLSGVGNPSLKSMTSLLQACSSLSDIQHGKEIHGRVIRTGADYQDEFFQTALVNMYMKCGCSLQARMIFDRTEKKSGDPALWNAMVSGYGRNGENDSALEIFRKMQEQRVEPNSATFLSALSVCSHTGQVEKGWELFRMMSRDYGIYPTAEHFGSMIDLLARAGKLAEALNLVQEIPLPSASVYSSLLGACWCYSDAKLGEMMAERLSELEPGSAIPFLILSNIYAGQGRWNDVERLREMMIERGLNKVSGCSWIGVKESQSGESISLKA